MPKFIWPSKFNTNMPMIRFFSMILFLLLLGNCKQKPHEKGSGTTSEKPENTNYYYTCSMHPQIHEANPGNCPICGMDLIKVVKTSNSDSSPIRLNSTQLQLAGIRTDTIGAQNTSLEKILTGTVTVGENQTESLNARVGGRIQQLFLKTVGEKIGIGQPVYSIYSEDLQEAAKEFLLAQQQKKELHNAAIDYTKMIAAAANKLSLWGLFPYQIKNLSQTHKVPESMTILSTVAGTVNEIAVHEGDYVSEGDLILKKQGLSSLWVQAQLYASEKDLYKEKDPVTVVLPDLGRQVIHSKIEFINPDLSGPSKVNLVRVVIPNPQGHIRPGMLAYILLGLHGKSTPVAVPASAVLRDGKGSKVWIQNKDGSFSSKIIETGPGNQSFLPVISGLSKGDIVVSEGAYLLNSEASFKSAGQ